MGDGEGRGGYKTVVVKRSSGFHHIVVAEPNNHSLMLILTQQRAADANTLYSVCRFARRGSRSAEEERERSQGSSG